ncbi:hypothetical protein JAAARDRAFT_470604 [Jaapia argillacea MUCL 33604]|uniref:Uncharacterized protein n=1 Tax=Jaapia argillacea MUCL 33604 TaxID=933084 RepID=A0A067QGW4_9AGAM|nr:hypothetical protein JAAARDRAFT_470604 [Jaapia argillacea MUCL 33604]
MSEDNRNAETDRRRTVPQLLAVGRPDCGQGDQGVHRFMGRRKTPNVSLIILKPDVAEFQGRKGRPQPLAYLQRCEGVSAEGDFSRPRT